jgi:SEC-C motif-containing protein
MRSRYSAYTLGLEPYLLSTWHPDTRPDALHLNEDQAIQWLGLQVKKAVTTGTTAIVDFVARYKVGGKAYRLCELSQFVCQDNVWYYLHGDQPASN